MQPQGYAIEPLRGDKLLTWVLCSRCIILHVDYRNTLLVPLQENNREMKKQDKENLS